MTSWTKGDSENARAEGWDVFFIDGDDAKPEIQVLADLQSDQWPGFFEDEGTDDAAIRFCELKAAQGSELHAKAIQLERSWDHGQERNYWEDPDWIEGGRGA